jgi:HPt (histidine-containing phosphotransfer) domain-containing protein
MTRQLDRQLLIDYYQGMEDEIAPIFEIFLQEVPASIGEIKKELAAQNLPEAKRLIHSIVPSFTSVGLPQLSVQLRAVEDCAAAGDGEGGILLMAAFEKQFTEYLPAVKEELERLNKLG